MSTEMKGHGDKLPLYRKKGNSECPHFNCSRENRESFRDLISQRGFSWRIFWVTTGLCRKPILVHLKALLDSCFLFHSSTQYHLCHKFHGALGKNSTAIQVFLRLLFLCLIMISVFKSMQYRKLILNDLYILCKMGIFQDYPTYSEE